MARILANKTNVIAPAAPFPFGRIKDDTGSNDGTPVDEDVYGDVHQFFEKLLDIVGITANDLPENDTNGFEWIEALKAVDSDTVRKAHGDLFDTGNTIGSSVELFSVGDVFIFNKKIYFLDVVGTQVEVYDLFTGSHLPAEDFLLGFSGARRFFIANNKAYVTSPTEVKVYDLSTGLNLPAEDFGAANLTSPEGLFIDAANDTAYVVDDSGTRTVEKFTVSTQTHVLTIGSGVIGSPSTDCYYVSKDDRLYVTGANAAPTTIVFNSAGVSQSSEDFGGVEALSPDNVRILGGKAYLRVSNEIFVYDLASTNNLQGETTALGSNFGGGFQFDLANCWVGNNDQTRADQFEFLINF